LGSGQRLQFLGEGFDDRPITDERPLVLGAPPMHRITTPVGPGPPTHRRHLGPVLLRPFDPQRELPAHRRLPVDRRLAVGEGREVQGAPRSPEEYRAVQEDAGTVDDPGPRPVVAENPVRPGLLVELEAFRLDHGGEAHDATLLVLIRHTGPHRAAALPEMLRRFVEDAGTSPIPDAGP